MSSKPMAAQSAPVAQSDEYEGRRLVKTIRWWDGFVLALAVPGFLFPSLGFSVAALGAVGAVVVWLVTVVIGAIQNNIYAELAVMMPNKSGGIGIYANEGLKRYTPFIGPLVVWGYWFGWSAVLSINGLLVGGFLIGELYPDAKHPPASVTLPLVGTVVGTTFWPPFIGTLMLIGIWVFNIFGLRPGVWLGYLLGILTMIPLLIVMFVPFVNGTFHSDNFLHSTLQNNIKLLSFDGIQLVLYWIYLAGWSAYGLEVVATFAPEYSDTIRDTPLALRTSAVFGVLVYGLVPLGLIGALGVTKIQANPYTAFAPALKAILGNGFGTAIVVVVIAALVLGANVATMDGSRSLWQMSKDGMTVTWLSFLSKNGVPSVAMTLDLVVQVALMWIFPTTPLYILAASNLGYILCHVCVLTAYILLRRDQPNAARPLRHGPIWVVIAGVLAVFNLVLILIGSWAPAAGGFSTLGVGIGLLALAFIFYLFRVYVQDRQAQARVA
jgi:amino acid transporter